MRDRPSSRSVSDSAPPDHDVPLDGPTAPARAATDGASFIVAGHAALFEASDGPRCDVCGEAVPPDEDEGPRLSGAGLYLSARGGEVRYDEVPLCPSCAAVLGMTALARWDLEEEEG